MSQSKGEWVDRARQIKLAGLMRTDSAELAAVYAALYPTAEPVRVGCYKCVAEAFQAVLRYLRTAPTDSSTSFSAVMSTATPKVERKYSFVDTNKTYRPHNSPVVFSNANLTDKLIGSILKSDPAMAVHFGISEEEGQEFVESLNQTPPSAEEQRADAFKQLEGLKRDELEGFYSSEVTDGQDPKTFANKTELINALLDSRAK
ncbi:hypothetical protein [Hymenobacter wooponensis]|uniref:Uncharacterized protein n=1 Tax=Hymenobacter wooponensis TaxID=1525360 RepID=A0A4Z0MLZ1_9BACT|nr:hypothetical protein [Hymenobacter wooponensis]TGD80308.1 hypothetical protein EU557_10715 [Hymenobacter wooponensis]